MSRLSLLPSAAELQAVRELASEADLLEALAGCAAARQLATTALAAAYERVLTIQVETIERRAVTGLAAALGVLEAIAGRIGRAIQDGLAPPEIAMVLEEVRRRVRLRGLGSTTRPADADLDRVLARIQALRAKTVDRGILRLPGLGREDRGWRDPLRVLRAAGGRRRGTLPL